MISKETKTIKIHTICFMLSGFSPKLFQHEQFNKPDRWLCKPLSVTHVTILSIKAWKSYRFGHLGSGGWASSSRRKCFPGWPRLQWPTPREPPPDKEMLLRSPGQTQGQGLCPLNSAVDHSHSNVGGSTWPLSHKTDSLASSVTTRRSNTLLPKTITHLSTWTAVTFDRSMQGYIGPEGIFMLPVCRWHELVIKKIASSSHTDGSM